MELGYLIVVYHSYIVQIHTFGLFVLGQPLRLREEALPCEHVDHLVPERRVHLHVDELIVVVENGVDRALGHDLYLVSLVYLL